MFEWASELKVPLLNQPRIKFSCSKRLRVPFADGPYLIIVHGHVELVVKFERLSPDDAPEPEAVVGVGQLGSGGHVQDVLVFVERTHVLT